MRAVGISLSVALVLVSLSAAQGQWGYGWGNYSSTVAEGYARGAADLTRSAGMGNLYNSQAAINYEDAQSKELDNRRKATESYFELRRINQQARAEEEARRRTSEGAFRYGQTPAVKRLTMARLDPVTGKLAWPPILEREKYAPQRQVLDELFVKRAMMPTGLIGDDYVRAVNACNSLLDDLKRDLPEYKPMDWIEAKNFVESVSYEARQPSS